MTAKIIVLGMLALSLFAQDPACLPVEGSQIRGSDLAHAIPAFRQVPPDAPLAPVPPLGGSRVFTETELRAMAARFSVNPGSLPEVCFRMATEQLARDRVLEAMQASLHSPGSRIQLFDISTEKVPRGQIEFPPEGLGRPALPDGKSSVVWRGAVLYGNGERFPVWGRVTVTAPLTRIIALSNLRSGAPIELSQLRSETIEGFPSQRSALQPEQVAGMVPLHNIAPGAEVHKDDLAPPIDVHKGDRVRVEVHMGAALVALSGRAEGNGRIGELISVVNPDSSKTFQARVEGKDRVVVELASLGR